MYKSIKDLHFIRTGKGIHLFYRKFFFVKQRKLCLTVLNRKFPDGLVVGVCP